MYAEHEVRVPIPRRLVVGPHTQLTLSTWFSRPRHPSADDFATARELLADAGIAPHEPVYFVAQVYARAMTQAAGAPSFKASACCTGRWQTLGKVHPFFDEVLIGVLEGSPFARVAFIYDCAAVGGARGPGRAFAVMFRCDAGPAFENLERRWSVSTSRVLRDAVTRRRLVALKVPGGAVLRRCTDAL